MNPIVPPASLKFLYFIPTLIGLMLIFHLPYLGIVLGSSVLSIIFRKHNSLLSNVFIRLAINNWPVPFTLGIIPPIIIGLLYHLHLYQSPIPIPFFILRITVLALVGFSLLWIYRKTGNFIMGFTGMVVLMIYSFFLLDIISLTLFPEKWNFLKAPIPYPLYSITPLFNILLFWLQSLLITGASLLFFFFKWNEKRLTVSPDTSSFLPLIKTLGYTLILLGTFPIPPLLILDLYNLPGYILSPPVFISAGLITFITCIIIFFTVSMIIDDIRGKTINEELKSEKSEAGSPPRYAVTVFALAISLFVLSSSKEFLEESTAAHETFMVIRKNTQKSWDDLTAKREEANAKNLIPDVKLGEKVFNDICSSCHSFDKKVFGPPFNSVLPKYANKENELTAFIRTPHKVDPQYPAMPNPGLSLAKTKSVAKFLLSHLPKDQKR